jgi:hypothetical protein
LQQVPLFITQISRIQDVTHPVSLATPLGQWLSIHLKNDFSDTLLASPLDNGKGVASSPFRAMKTRLSLFLRDCGEV